jgi:hypothetical protein
LKLSTEIGSQHCSSWEQTLVARHGRKWVFDPGVGGESRGRDAGAAQPDDGVHRSGNLAHLCLLDPASLPWPAPVRTS